MQTETTAGTTDFLFNASGRRVSMWSGPQGSQIQGQYYWGSKPVAFYKNGATHFQHQDWLGTERMRTTYSAGVEGTYTSLPFGDAQTTSSGTDLDSYHFAMLDYNSETSADYAQFRQYSSLQGRWMISDPYSGSYDFSDPQSFNRYAYALNNPLSLSDLSGLDYGFDCGANCVGVVGTDGPDPCDSNPFICVGFEPPEGPLQPLKPPAPPPPPPPPPPGSMWSCIKSGMEDFSLQKGLQTISGGSTGNGWLANAFLGNSIEGLGNVASDLYNGSWSSAGNEYGDALAQATVQTGAIYTNVSSSVPNVAVNVSAVAVSQNGAVSVSFAADLPLGSMAQAGAQALSDGLGFFGNVIKLPYDLSVASFSAVACSLWY